MAHARRLQDPPRLRNLRADAQQVERTLLAHLNHLVGQPPHLGELKAWPEAGRIPQLPSVTATMTPRRGSCPLLLFSLVGLLMTCAQEPGVAGQNTTEVAEKAGICPQAELERPDGNCTEECQSDARCEGNQKCCQTGCGTSCQIPDEKVGSCPNVDIPIPPLGICRTTCQTDSNCPNIKKCCKNGCGFMTCSTPKP